MIKNDPKTQYKSHEIVPQGGDLPAGMQALPVGKIIETKVLRKDNPEIVQTCKLFE